MAKQDNKVLADDNGSYLQRLISCEQDRQIPLRRLLELEARSLSRR